MSTRRLDLPSRNLLFRDTTPMRPESVQGRTTPTSKRMRAWVALARGITLLLAIPVAARALDATESSTVASERASQTPPRADAPPEAPVGDKVLAAPAPGFRHVDAGFSGQFEDEQGDKIVLDTDGKSYTGSLSFAGDWSIAATVRGGKLVGTASAAPNTETFEASFEGERLHVRVGSAREARLARTLAENPQIADLGPVVEDPARRWTLAVYLGGDNDLETGAMLDLEELRASMPETGVEVVVLLDRAVGHLDEEGNWTDAHVFRLKHGSEGAPILKALGEIDTGDPATLASFLCGTFRTFPAPQRAVVVWDHGGGWTGIVQDEDSPGRPGHTSLIELHDVRVALRTAAWHTGGATLDLLAFDACLMGQLEVALAVQDQARFLVASEASVPGLGFPYDAVLPLFADASFAPRDVARGIVDAFGRSYDQAHHPATTISALDLSRVGSLAGALDAFAARCQPEAKRQWPALARALYYAEAYEPRTERELPGVAGSRDLLDLLHRVRNGMNPFPASAELTAVEEELGRAVVASHVGDRRRASHGISVYAPYRGDQWRASHSSTPMGGGNRFTELVRRVHQLAVSGAKDPVTFADARIDGAAPSTLSLKSGVTRPLDGSRLTFTMTGTSVVAVEEWDAVRDGEGFAVLRKNWVPDPAWMKRAKETVADEADLFMPVFVDGRNELALELTGLQFRVTNDEDMVLATMDATAPAIDAPIVARARMMEPGATVPLEVEVHFDRALWHAGEVYEIDTTGSNVEPRQIQPTPEHTFAFLVETRGDDGTAGFVLGPPLAWKKGLGLVLTVDEPGEYRTLLAARTMDGRVFETHVDYRSDANPDVARWTESWRTWDPKVMPGTWNREVATGPDAWSEIDAPSRILASPDYAPGIFDVVSTFGPVDRRETLNQLWIFDTRGVPNLRIVTPLEGQRKLCWYGPACFGGGPDRPWVVFKAIQLGGVLMRYRLSNYDFLLRLDIEGVDTPPEKPK